MLSKVRLRGSFQLYQSIGRGITFLPRIRMPVGRLTLASYSSLMVDETVAELMKSKPKAQDLGERKGVDSRTKQTTFHGRDGLVVYTQDPAAFPHSRVVYYNDKFVVINDLFPKATVHLLILPRDPRRNVLMPQEAFDDPVFLAECKAEERKVREIVAAELRRKLGPYSGAEKVRNEAMDSDDPPDTLPPGRDWSREVISGTHANPSMNHLHIHVLSRDMHSECMKKKNHYLSFTTDFLIPVSDYPLAKDDFRRDYRHFTEPDMRCWRCGKEYGNKMAQLKEHLEAEFEEWRRD